VASDEVCQLLNLSESNQRVLLHRGRSKIRSVLEDRVAARTSSYNDANLRRYIILGIQSPMWPPP
jgi:hypothetical protein